MTLICKHCGSIFSSLDLDKDVALREVSDKLARHALAKHKIEQGKAFEVLKWMNIWFTWYIFMAEFVEMEDSATTKVDPYFKEKIEEVEGKLAELIGLEAESNEEKSRIIT